MSTTDPPGLTFPTTVSGDRKDKHDALGKGATDLLWIHLERTAVAGTGPADHHVIDRAGKRVEEASERIRIARVERRAAHRADVMGGFFRFLVILSGPSDPAESVPGSVDR